VERSLPGREDAKTWVTVENVMPDRDHPAARDFEGRSIASRYGVQVVEIAPMTDADGVKFETVSFLLNPDDSLAERYRFNIWLRAEDYEAGTYTERITTLMERGVNGDLKCPTCRERDISEFRFLSETISAYCEGCQTWYQL
jgi:hypothetical protein